jgi:hypothetical protein
MAEIMMIDDENFIDIDEILAHARRTLRASSNDDAVAEDALGTILHLIAMFVTRAKHDEDDEIVAKFAQFADECMTAIDMQ